MTEERLGSFLVSPLGLVVDPYTALLHNMTLEFRTTGTIGARVMAWACVVLPYLESTRDTANDYFTTVIDLIYTIDNNYLISMFACFLTRQGNRKAMYAIQNSDLLTQRYLQGVLARDPAFSEERHIFILSLFDNLPVPEPTGSAAKQ